MSLPGAILGLGLGLVFGVLTLALAERLALAGLRNWRWLLAGFVLVTAGAALQAAFQVRTFAELFVPSVAGYAQVGATVVQLLGWTLAVSAVLAAAVRTSKQRENELDRQDRFKLLDAIRDTVTQPFSLIELLNFSVKELVKGTGSQAGCALIYNPGRNQLVLAAQHNLPQDLEKRLEKIEDTGSLLFRTHKHGRAHLIGNLDDADRSSTALLGPTQLKSVLAVPLLTRNGSLGITVLFAQAPYFYSREDTQLVSSAGTILGPAVSTYRLERELREIARTFQSLKKSSTVVNGLFDLVATATSQRAALQALADFSAERCGYSGLAVFRLVGQIPKAVFPEGGAALSEDFLASLRRAVADNRSLIVREAKADGWQRAVILPLSLSGGARAACILRLDEQRSELGQDDVDLLRAVAKAVALVLTAPGEKVSLGGLPGSLEELNEVNNILTGVVGKAQLLGFGLRREAFSYRDQALMSLEDIAAEAYQAGQLIRRFQEIAQTPIQSDGQKASLGAALRVVMVPAPNSDGSSYVVSGLPKLRVKYAPQTTHAVRLSERNLRLILQLLFEWIENEWSPPGGVSVGLLDRKTFSYLLVSEAPLLGMELTLESREYKPAALFPHPEVFQDARADLDFDFYLDQSGLAGRLLVLRFAHTLTAGPEAAAQGHSSAVLAIDDQEVIRELLASMLRELGYPFEICADGKSGLAALASGRFEIVITDLGLPDIDGWQLVRRVRELKPQTSVIVISGWGTEVTPEKAAEHGADFVLAKPFRMEQLGALVKEAESRSLHV